MIGIFFCYSNFSQKLDFAENNFNAIKTSMKSESLEIVEYKYGDIFNFISQEKDKLRLDEIVSLTTTDGSTLVSLVVSRRYERKIDAILGLLSVVLLSMVMLISIYLFNRDMYLSLIHI